MDELKKQKSAQAVRALCERIVHYFADEIPQEEAIVVHVEPGQRQSAPEEESARCTLRVVLPDGTPLEGFLRAVNTGGNMYEVDVGLADHAECFSLSLPSEITASGGSYAKPVCAFLLQEVKQRAGELFLREATAKSTAAKPQQD